MTTTTALTGWQQVGRRLRLERVSRDLVQEQVAAETGIRQEEVSRDERGRGRSGIAPDRLVIYAHYYGIDWRELLAPVYDVPVQDVPRARSDPRFRR